ncbi:L-seryl-tRNA(Sec) kinase-like isoform X1 [Mytilus edulis]|uniref:L-seryl-tRNA(Sec) kinase-like isoform X1 n=1 Tax=Mytilus edulis TaxID=6550 RepID=UPI0039EEDC5F
MDTQSSKSSKCLVVLSGIPGCGKSTLAKLLYDKLGGIYVEEQSTHVKSSKCFDVIVVSYDELIPENIPLDAKSQQTWKEYREEIAFCIDYLVNKEISLANLTKPPPGVNDALWGKFYAIVRRQITSAESVVIVLDDNMYYTSMRHKYFQIARKYTCGFCQLHLACNIQTALERNLKRSQPITEDVIVAMATKIEPPNTHINSWETNSIVINTESNIESQLPRIMSLVNTAMLNPVQPIEETDPMITAESRQICSSNVIHQSDQILRKIVSHKMSNLKGIAEDKSTLQQLSKKYIDIRKTCLDKIKSGQVSFPVAVDEPNVSCDINSELYQQILRLFEQLLKEIT